MDWRIICSVLSLIIIIIIIIIILDALRPVLRAVGRCEARIEEQQETLHNILAAVNSLKQQQLKVSAVTAIPDTSVLDEFLPLQTYEDLTVFENKLSTDSTLKLALVRSYCFVCFRI